jgi:Tfp pilus assembly protein PilN
MANLLNAEYTLVQSGRRAVRWLRRLATRILLVQVHAELTELRERQDRLERQLHALLGQRYDSLAAAQRLAALEDRVREWQRMSEAECSLPKKG